MPSHHFISYSSADAQDFALRLCDTLAAGPPSFPVWLDKRKLQAGEDWDAQIVEAIKTCVSMLFVMTRDSVEDESVCKNEWVSALSYKKLIVAIKLHHDAELPFRLASRRFIDFTGEFEPALARLRERLQCLDSPAGTLRTLKDRRADAQRDLRRTADPTQQARIQDELALLEQQIADQQRIVDNPQAAAQRVEQSIVRGLERERQPEQPVAGAARSKFINLPPAPPPKPPVGMLCEGGQHILGAIAAYRAARAINKNAGVIARVLRLFDTLALADSAGLLAGVRPTAGG